MEINTIAIIAVSCFGAVMIIGSVGVTIFLIVRAFKGGKSSRSAKSDASETKMIQEIYRGMSKMEDRVESLETLLMESEKVRREKRKMSDFDQELERE